MLTAAAGDLLATFLPEGRARKVVFVSAGRYLQQQALMEIL